MSNNLNLMEQKENANADCLQRLVRPPTTTALQMRAIGADFVKSNGWTDIVTNIPGSPKIKSLYKSPLTGNYHSLSFALGMVLESHGIAAA